MSEKYIFRNEFISKTELDKQIDKLLECLKLNKIIEGDIIAFRSSSHYGSLIHWLSCIKAGIIPLLLQYDYHIDKIDSILDITGAKGLIETEGVDKHNFYKFERYSNNNFKILRKIEIGSALHMTSATTGIPKIVLRTKKQLDAEVDRYIFSLRHTENDVFLPIVPLYHSFGFGSGLLTAIKSKATLVIPDLIFPRDILEMCNKNKVSVILGIPYFYKKMLELPYLYKFNKDMKYVLSSGGPLDNDLRNKFAKKFNVHLTQQYGSTETGSLAISNNDDMANTFSIIFKGVEVKIEMDNNIPWIYVKTPDTIGSYLNYNMMYSKDEFFKMGDIGSITKSNQLYISDRGDDILIIAGKKYSIENIKIVLDKNQKINCYKLYKNESNDLVCDYYSNENVEPHVLKEYCRQHLPEYQIPKYFNKVKSAEDIKNDNWKKLY